MNLQEVLELVHELNQTQGLTVLMVLHDLNHAAAFADQMVVLNRGAIVRSGEPWSILQPDLLHDVFGVAASIIREPQSGKPLIVAHRSAARDAGQPDFASTQQSTRTTPTAA